MTRVLLDNRHGVFAFALAIAVFGAYSYARMPMQLFPETAPPLVQVLTLYPGASAEDVAEQLTEVVEAEVASVPGVTGVRSSSQDGLSIVSVEFGYDEDIDVAAVGVQNAVSRTRGELPSAIVEPQVLTFSSNDRPVVTLALTGTDPRVVRRLAEDEIAPRLQRVEGVAAVDVFGGSVETVWVDVDPEALFVWPVTLERIAEVVRAYGASMPAGEVRGPDRHEALRMSPPPPRVEALEEIPIPLGDGSSLRVADLARVHRGTLDDDALVALDGRQAIAVQVFKTTEANTVQVVADAVAAAHEIDAARSELEVSVGEESASFTAQSIGSLLGNVWQALLLAAIVLFLFLGRPGASLVTSLSMPLSYGLTFAGMRMLDIELNMVTLTAIILAMGMVVDASVVILENVLRHREVDGLDAVEAAAAGADEVRLAVLAGVGTTVVVLVPLLFLDGFVGRTFGPLAATLLLAFVSSAVVALLVVPVLTLYAVWGGRLDRLSAVAVRPFEWAMERFRGGYELLLGRALRWRVATLVIAFGLLAGGVRLLVAQGMDVLPRMDTGAFFVALETLPGSSLGETRRAVQAVEEILAAEPEVVAVQSQIGFERGMRTSSAVGARGPTQGYVSVTLTPRTTRTESIWRIESRVRAAAERIPGVRSLTVREVGNTATPTTVAPVVVRLSGPDPGVLDALGDDVLEALRGVPTVLEPTRAWRMDHGRFAMVVDAERAAAAGTSPAAVAAALQQGTVGVAAGLWYGPEGDGVPVRVRFARDGVRRVDDLLELPVAVGAVGAVRAESLARIERFASPPLVTRDNLQTTLEVTAIGGDVPISFVFADVERALSAVQVPVGYALELTGEATDLRDARQQLGGAIAVALVAVYLLLVAQLRSFVHPITILVSVPLSLFGVAVALRTAGMPVSMPVMVGLVLLVGIVVNNAIILLEFVRHSRAEGMERRDALIAAVRTRFRPIMMTSLSTIVGMIPLAGEWALGAERFSPLAVAVIGGLTTATVQTMVIVPVWYDLLDDIAQRARGLLSRPRGAAAVAGLLLAALPMGGGAHGQGVGDTLEMDEAVRLAIGVSPSVGAAGAAVEATEAASSRVASLRLPSLRLVASYSRLSEAEPGALSLPQLGTDSQSGVPFGDSIRDRVIGRVEASQLVFHGFSVRRRMDAGEAAEASAETMREVAEADVALRTRTAWLRLWLARERLGVLQAGHAVLDAHQRQVVALHEAGRATDLDLLSVEARLASNEATEAAALGEEAVALMALRALTALPVGADVQLGALSFEGPPSDGAPGGATDGGPDVQVARDGVHVADAAVAVARTTVWPRVMFVAGYQVANPNDRYVPPAAEFRDSWDATLVLDWQLYAGGARRHGVREAEARRTEAEYRLDAVRQASDLEIAAWTARWDASRRSAEAAEAAVVAAEAALAAATELHALGVVSSAEVLDRFAELEEMRLARAAAWVDAATAQAELARRGVVGRGFVD